MRGQAFIYRPEKAEPEVVALDSCPSADFLQSAVGGHFQLVPNWTQFELAGATMPCRAFCNEEGKLGMPGPRPGILPVNNAATRLWDRALRKLKNDAGEQIYPTGLFDLRTGTPIDHIVGTVIVVTGDDELMNAL